MIKKDFENISYKIMVHEGNYTFFLHKGQGIASQNIRWNYHRLGFSTGSTDIMSDDWFTYDCQCKNNCLLKLVES